MMEVAAIHDVRTGRPADAAGAATGFGGDGLLDLIHNSLEDDKAEDIVVIDLARKSTMADHMVIASGRSSRQVGAMAEHLREKLKAAGAGNVAVEGLPRCDWVLIDGGDVIVHLFRPEVRAFYNLEKMWGGPLAEEPDAVHARA